MDIEKIQGIHESNLLIESYDQKGIKARQKVDFNFDHLDHSFIFPISIKYEIMAFLIEAETISKKVHLFIYYDPERVSVDNSWCLTTS